MLMWLYDGGYCSDILRIWSPWWGVQMSKIWTFDAGGNLGFIQLLVIANLTQVWAVSTEFRKPKEIHSWWKAGIENYTLTKYRRGWIKEVVSAFPEFTLRLLYYGSRRFILDYYCRMRSIIQTAHIPHCPDNEACPSVLEYTVPRKICTRCCFPAFFVDMLLI